MFRLRVFTLVPLLTVAGLSACTPSATSEIESTVSSDISVEDAADATVKAMSIEVAAILMTTVGLDTDWLSGVGACPIGPTIVTILTPKSY